MLVKYDIAKYPLLKQALKPLTDLAYKTIQEYINGEKAHMLSEKALKERALYNIPVAILHGAFKSRYANSQESAYINLKNDINIAISTLFNNHSVSVVSTTKAGKKKYEIKSAYEVDAKNAIKPYVKTVRRIYERRIERAILKGKKSINLISNKTLLRYFNLSMRKVTNKEVVQEVASTIHSIYYHLQVSGIDVNKLTNNYAENKQLLLSFWYDCNVKSFDVTNNLIVRDNGIYRKKKDGTIVCSCRFRSHLFNGEYFSDSFYFGVNSKNETVLNVLQYRSLYEALFSIANKCIDENRRSYTSTKKEVQEKDGSTKELDITDCFSYDEKGYINIEENEEELRAIVLKALLKNGMKYPKAVPFCNALLLNKVEGLPQTIACEYGGLSHVTFIKYWKQYKHAIGQALLKHKSE